MHNGIIVLEKVNLFYSREWLQLVLLYDLLKFLVVIDLIINTLHNITYILATFLCFLLAVLPPV